MRRATKAARTAERAAGRTEEESCGRGKLAPFSDSPSALPAARAAVLAAFVALLVHTMAYAGFFEDPITWVLLAIGASLATEPTVRKLS